MRFDFGFDSVCKVGGCVPTDPAIVKLVFVSGGVFDRVFVEVFFKSINRTALAVPRAKKDTIPKC